MDEQKLKIKRSMLGSISIRLPIELLDTLDNFVNELNLKTLGSRLTRSDGLRMVLTEYFTNKQRKVRR